MAWLWQGTWTGLTASQDCTLSFSVIIIISISVVTTGMNRATHTIYTFITKWIHTYLLVNGYALLALAYIQLMEGHAQRWQKNEQWYFQCHGFPLATFVAPWGNTMAASKISNMQILCAWLMFTQWLESCLSCSLLAPFNRKKNHLMPPSNRPKIGFCELQQCLDWWINLQFLIKQEIMKARCAWQSKGWIKTGSWGAENQSALLDILFIEKKDML